MLSSVSRRDMTQSDCWRGPVDALRSDRTARTSPHTHTCVATRVSGRSGAPFTVHRRNPLPELATRFSATRWLKPAALNRRRSASAVSKGLGDSPGMSIEAQCGAWGLVCITGALLAWNHPGRVVGGVLGCPVGCAVLCPIRCEKHCFIGTSRACDSDPWRAYSQPGAAERTGQAIEVRLL